MTTRWPSMSQPECAWCHQYPCRCERRMCACGRAVDIVRDDVTASISAHNRTPEHVVWRRREGL